MRTPALRLNRRPKRKEVCKFKRDIEKIVHYGLMDIEDYIVNDVMNYMEKRGFINVQARKKNKTKKSR